MLILKGLERRITMPIEWKRNEDGELVAYENGKEVGKIDQMGDEVKYPKEDEDKANKEIDDEAEAIKKREEEEYQEWLRSQNKENTEEQPKEEFSENSIKKIRSLLKRYGAADVEIEHFIKDLAEYKEDLEEIQDAIEDEQKGSKEYKNEKNNNELNENDEMYEEMAKDEKKHEEYLLNAQNLALLKATKEGRELIRKAPEMPKESLKQAILGYLSKNK